jgi:hypothetical protein
MKKAIFGAVWWILTDISDEHAASIIVVEESYCKGE